jgi:(p)ppGpp synthase/HD superfamily hydrolase
MFSPERYVDAMRFAAAAHKTQTEQGSDLPYLVHIVAVAAEVIAALPAHPELDGDLAVTCALLHDTVEDTSVTLDAIRARYGDAVAAGVSALTKDGSAGDKTDQMLDSLRRIKAQPREIAIVKLADRITNMAEPPPHWSKDKRIAYRAEATVIADTLGYASATLGARLRARIAAYAAFC